MAIAFAPDTLKQIQELRSRYPDAQAACLPVLHLAQDEFGRLSDEAIHLVAETLGLPPAHVFGVVTFYTMFHRDQRGKNEIMVCTNISCMLRGGYEVLDKVCSKLGVKPGETTSDGQFTVIEEECLAACADAPMAICGREYYLRLEGDAQIDAMLADIRKRGGA